MDKTSIALSAVETTVLTAQLVGLSKKMDSLSKEIEKAMKEIEKMKLAALIAGKLNESGSSSEMEFVAVRKYYGGEYTSQWEVYTKDEFQALEHGSDEVYIVITINGDDVTFSEETSNVPFESGNM